VQNKYKEINYESNVNIIRAANYSLKILTNEEILQASTDNTYSVGSYSR
jgi:hypothetical protein